MRDGGRDPNNPIVTPRSTLRGNISFNFKHAAGSRLIVSFESRKHSDKMSHPAGV